MLNSFEVINNTDPVNISFKDNLTQAERKALEELRNQDDFVLKKSDKGNMLVLIDKSFYRDKLVIADHLNTSAYRPATKKDEKLVMKNLKLLIDKHSKCLTNPEIEYCTDFEDKCSNFHVLPKIHKNKEIIEAVSKSDSVYIEMDPPNDLKARPIVAATNNSTSKISELLEKILSPLVKNLRSYIKDDWDFLRKLPREITKECDLYSFDITSLYTNIEHDLGINALKYYIDKFRGDIQDRFTKEFIIELSLIYKHCTLTRIIERILSTIF